MTVAIAARKTAFVLLRRPLMALPLALMVVACGKSSPATKDGPGADAGAAGADAVTGSTAGTGGGAGGGTGGSSSAGDSGAAGARGSTGGAGPDGGGTGSDGSTSTGDTGADADGIATRSRPSPGCGKALDQLVAPGRWSNMADEKGRVGMPPPVPITGPDGTTVLRGFFVWVPTTYDANMPARVIYQGAGAGDTLDLGGTSGFPYNTVDASGQQTILVGIDYTLYTGTHAAVPSYDEFNPLSNDFAFFPFLRSFTENDFCVDLGRELFSGSSGGAALANQLTCAFPDVLRGVVEASGFEPSTLPTCAGGGRPTAALFLHDLNDAIEPIQAAFPSCGRMLAQNGCSVTDCDLSNPSSFTPHATGPFPSSAPPPGSLKCMQFNGCPAEAPVVFCTTALQESPISRTNVYAGAAPWITPLFWSFLNGL